MKKDYLKKVIYYVLSFVLPLLVITVALLGLAISPFGEKTLLITDGNGLYVNFISYVARVIKGLETITYSFEKSIGGNMMDSWGWFLLNPFFALFTLFDITAYPIAYTYISALNLSACGLTMYMLLCDIWGHRRSNLIFSTSYALNGFLVANVFQMNFFTGVFTLPLMVMGLRRVFKDRSPVLYIVSLAYSLLTNFYFGFMLCIASLLFFFMFFFIDGGLAGKRKVVTIKYAISSILAGLISSFIWIPALFALRGGRLEQTKITSFSFGENMPFLEIGTKLFSGANSWTQLQYGLPNIFVGILPIALVILFFLNRKINNKKKIASGLILVFYLISFYIHAIDMLMHGGTTTNWFNYRYSFVFCFLLLIIAAYEWQYIYDELGTDLKRAVVIMIVSTILIFSKEYEYIHGGEVLFDYCVLLIILLALKMYKKTPTKNNKMVFEIIVIIMICINLFVNYRVSTKNILGHGVSNTEYTEVVTPVSAIVDAVKMTDSNDFYRMEIDDQRSGTQGNDTMLYGYNGVGHGGSDARNNIRNVLSQLGIRRFDMRNSYCKGIPSATDNFLGLKYIISKDNLTEQKEYVLMSELQEWKLYKNENALPIVMLADSKVVDIKLDYEDVFQNLNDTWSAISGQADKIFTEESDITFTAHNKMDSTIITREEAIKASSDQDSENNNGGAVESDVSNNGEHSMKEAPKDSAYIEISWTASSDGNVFTYNRSGMLDDAGSYVHPLFYEGNHKKGDIITEYLSLTSDYDYVPGYLLEDVAARFKVAYEDKETLNRLGDIVRERPATIEKVKDNYLKGEFVADQGQLLMFTIPYDEGWSVSIDGVTINPIQVMGAFMAVEVEPGLHTYEMRFTPPGMKVAVVISVLAFIGLIVFMFVMKSSKCKSPVISEFTGCLNDKETLDNDMSKDETSDNTMVKAASCANIKQERYDIITFVLMVVLCIIPVLMSIFNMFMGATGRLFSEKTIQQAMHNYDLGINYLLPTNVYRTVFIVLGITILVWASICTMLSWRRVINYNHVKAYPWLYLLLALLVWAGICSLVSNDLLRAFFGNNMLFDGLFSYIVYASVFVCASMIRTEKQRKALLYCFSAMAVWLAVIMLAEEGGNAFLRACMPSRRAVVFIQFNHFGYVLCMGIIVLVGLFIYDERARKWVKAVYLIALGVLVQALLVNDTFGCYLATVVALPIVYLFYRMSGRRIRLAVLLPLFVFIGISAANYMGIGQTSSVLSSNVAQLGTDIQNIATGSEAAAQAGTLRFVKWMDTIKRIGERPIFGFGPEGFYGAYSITEGDAPHNEYLQIAGYLGIPGLLLYLSAIVTLAIHSFRHIKIMAPFVLAVSGVTVVYLISACFGVPVFNTAPYFWMFLGMTTATRGNEKPLICPDREEMDSLFADKKRKERTIIAVVGAILIMSIVLISAFSAIRDEHLYEFADLQAMRGADLTAQADYKNGKISGEGEYWYDANGYQLIPADQPKPESYGLGRYAVGNAWYEFCENIGVIYDYDESTDYRDKIICLTANIDSSGSLHTHVRWVNSD